MSRPKTQPTTDSVDAFLAAIADPERRADCLALAELMRGVTGEAPRLWGPTIVGFGSYHYRYASGREGDWMLTGFSPRKRDLTVYVMSGFEDHADLLTRLGKHKTGKSCLYLKRLGDIDLYVLRELLAASLAQLRRTWGGADSRARPSAPATGRAASLLTAGQRPATVIRRSENVEPKM